MPEWLFENYMVLKSGKCHMLIGNKNQPDKINFSDTEITSK